MLSKIDRLHDGQTFVGYEGHSLALLDNRHLRSQKRLSRPHLRTPPGTSPARLDEWKADTPSRRRLSNPSALLRKPKRSCSSSSGKFLRKSNLTPSRPPIMEHFGSAGGNQASYCRKLRSNDKPVVPHMLMPTYCGPQHRSSRAKSRPPHASQ